MWLLKTAIKSKSKAELHGIWKCSLRKNKSDLIFCYLLVMKSMCSSKSTHLPLGSFGANSSVNKKNQLHSQCQAWKSIKQKVSCFFFLPSKEILTFSWAFLFVPASIQSFSFSSMSIKAQRTPSINSSIYKKIPQKSNVKARNFRQGSLNLNQVARKLLQGSKLGGGLSFLVHALSFGGSICEWKIHQKLSLVNHLPVHRYEMGLSLSRYQPI